MLTAAALIQLKALEDLSGFRQQAIESQLVGYRAVVASAFDAQGASAKQLSKEPGLVNLFNRGDQKSLNAAAKVIHGRLPEATSVRMLLPGVNELDTSQVPHLGYADLLELRKAEEPGGGQVPLEVLAFNRPNEHFNRIYPIVDKSKGNKVVGLMVVHYQVKLIQQVLNKVGGVTGKVEIQQGVGPKALALARIGDFGGSSILRAGIAGTNWSVTYSPVDAGAIEGLANWIPILIFAGSGVLIVLIVSWMLFKKFGNAFRRDQATMLHLVKDLVRRRMQLSYPLQVKDFKDMRDVLVEMGREFAATAPVQEVKKPMAASTGSVDSAADPIYQTGQFEVVELAEDEAAQTKTIGRIPDSIFRAYDIRGVAGEELSRDVMFELGRSFGSEAFEQGQQVVAVARDGRKSSPELFQSFCKGLVESGRDVIDVGMVPTPVLYFAAEQLASGAGAMITGSHNPAEDNGLKMMLAGESLTGAALSAIRQRVETSNYLSGQGAVRQTDVIGDYIAKATGGVQIARPFKVVIDCGNGVGGVIAKRLYQAIGCEVTVLYEDVDGDFPNHHPDPCVPENMQDLQAAVRQQKADIGLAFDGDADRLGVVDGEGRIIWPDLQMMLFAVEVLRENAGAAVVFDVKCTRNLPRVIKKAGGKPVMARTGHSFLQAKMKETGALLGGELSGHLIFRDRWFGFVDALYGGIRMLQLLARDQQKRSPTEILAGLPEIASTPELRLDMQQGEPQKFMDKLLNSAPMADGKITDIDGLRVDFKEGWGLVRASNTTASLVLRFEAENKQALEHIQDTFRLKLLSIDPELNLPF